VVLVVEVVELVEVVGAAGVPAPAVVPAPEPAGGWKNTTRSNVDGLDLHPPDPDEVEGPAEPAALDPAFTAEASVTLVTPVIRRSLDISRATSSWLAVQP